MTEILFDDPANTGITKYNPTTLPDTPTNVQATATGSTVVVTWSGTTGSYNVYRNTAYVSTVTAETWTDVAVVDGTTYSYKVVSIDQSKPEGFQYSASSEAATVTYNSATPELGDPVHTSQGAILTGDTHLVTWDDPNRPDTRNYDQFVNGVDQGNSEVNTTSRLVTVPTDGSMVTITTKYWDNGVIPDPPKSISYQIQAASLNSVDLTGYTKIALPQTDTAYGSFTSGKLGEIMAPSSAWYMDGSGDVSIGNVEGGRALIARLRPLTTGDSSNKIKSAVYLPSVITGRTAFKLAFEMRLRSGFSFGINNSSQTFKFGFGLRSLVDSSVGDPNYSGWSTRFIGRGNGDGTVDVNVYSYSAKTAAQGYGDDIPTEHKMTIGTWDQYVIEQVLNDVGESNGILRVWINGIQKINILDMYYQRDGTPNCSGISWTNYYGGSGIDWRPANTSYMEFRSPAWLEGDAAPSEAKSAWLPSTSRPGQPTLTLPTTLGSKVTEPTSGSIIECVNSTGWRHDYVWSPENADGTLLALHNPGAINSSDTTNYQDIIVNADTFAVVRNKGYDLGAYRRWSANDPDTMYTCGKTVSGVADNKLFAYHPSTDAFEVIFDFNTLGFTDAAGWLITIGMGDGDIDWNDKYAPVSVYKTSTSEYHMFVIDIPSKAVHSTVNWNTLQTRDAINIPAGLQGQAVPSYNGEEASFTMTRDGLQCVVWRGGNGTDAWPSMLEVYNNDWTNRREVGALKSDGTTWATMHVSHMVTGVDQSGNQVIINEQHPDDGNYFVISTGEFVHYPHGAFGHQSVSKGLPGYVAHYGYDTTTDPAEMALSLVPLRKTGTTAVHEANTHGLPIFPGAPIGERRQYGYHRSSGLVYTNQPQYALTHIGDKGYFVSNQSGSPYGYRVRAPG